MWEGGRLNALLERSVLPGSSHLLETRDPMEAELGSPRVILDDDVSELTEARA